MQKSYYTIGHIEIPQFQLMNIPLNDLESNNTHDSSVTFIFKVLKKLTNYQYDNTHLKWSNIYGYLFSINIHYNDNKLGKFWEIHLWDQTGTKSLLCFTQEAENKFTDKLSQDNYNKLCEISEKFVKGIISCSDCKKEITTSEIGGQYFAGIYCEDCWNRKWKAIEASETYD